MIRVRFLAAGGCGVTASDCFSLNFQRTITTLYSIFVPISVRITLHTLHAMHSLAPFHLLYLVIWIVRSPKVSSQSEICLLFLSGFCACCSMDDRQGWTASPNNRGTIDIIWNCVLTTFLCCWSVLVINVPSPGSSSSQVLFRKLLLLGLCALAPEIIFQIALGQWLSAYRSVKLFHDAGYTDWTVSHGFYADMGGLHLETSNWKAFPINAEQLHYLVTQKNIEYPKIRESHIRDKNKVDGMLRFITLVQTAWFIINIIARGIQNLAITAIELSTAAFVLLSVATTFCWVHKPADVFSSDYIMTDQSIEDISRDDSNDSSRPYRDTPLDFVGRHEWAWSILWSQGLNYLRALNLAAPQVERPISRFQNTIAHVIDGSAYFAFFWLSLGYFAIFIGGWNFAFPTEIETILWRAASLTAVVSVLGMFVNMRLFFSSWYPALRQRVREAASRHNESDTGRESTSASREPREKRNLISTFLRKLRNSSIMKDPEMDAPAAAVLTTWFCGIFYCSARLYIFTADIIELRSLPPSAYQEVDWISFWPHF